MDTKRREKKKARRQELKFQVETDPQAAAERASNRRLKHPFSIPSDGLEPRFGVVDIFDLEGDFCTFSVSGSLAITGFQNSKTTRLRRIFNLFEEKNQMQIGYF